MDIKLLGNFRHCMLAREIRQRDGFIAPLINMPDPGIAAVEILGVYALSWRMPCERLASGVLISR